MCYRGHIACLPPSTGSVAPVMKDASLEARKAITFATSSAFPGRPKACVSFERSKNCARKNRYRVKVNQRQMYGKLLRYQRDKTFSWCLH